MAVKVEIEPPMAYISLSAAAGEAEVYLLPAGRYDRVRSISVTVEPAAGGSAELDTSTRSPAAIEAGTPSWVPVQIGGSTRVAEISGVPLPASLSAVRLRAAGAAAEAHLCLAGVS